jgi:autophagy-related protein 9
MELPAMAEGLLEEEEEFERSWEPPVRNLDKFFTSMYHYHNTKGLPTILITQLCSVISLGFTTSFSIFLLGFIDWSALKNCHDEASCGGASHYIASNPFQQFSFARNLFILIYSFILIAFWLWRSYHSFNIVKRAVQMEKFYREKLGIKVSDLPSLQWDDIVQRLIKLHDHGVHRVAVKEKLTEHDVVLRIMRKDNYMIGLINKNILDLRVPWWIAPFISERLFLTKSLEWSLSFCIMEYIFNDQFAISTLFLKDINGLRGRFVMVGLIHLALLPFMIIFMSISFFLQNAQSFHSNKAYLGPRQWSPLALWTFREFNELPHIFDERINKSISPANEYISLFHNVNAVIVARSAAYITGSFVATLLVLSFLAEGVFLYVNVADHNMLWWLGVFSAMYAGARSVIPDETKIASDPEELMQKISSYTHYFPLHWTNNCHTYAVRNDLAELFPYKAKVFAMEVLSVVMTPLVLCFSLPHCAPTIIEFVRYFL